VVRKEIFFTTTVIISRCLMSLVRLCIKLHTPSDPVHLFYASNAIKLSLVPLSPSLSLLLSPPLVPNHPTDRLQVTFSTTEHSPSNADESSCYGTITNLRVVLLDFFPELRLSNTSFQYYGIHEWIVRGSCACNGHSGSCVPAAGEDLATGKVRQGGSPTCGVLTLTQQWAS